MTAQPHHLSCRQPSAWSQVAKALPPAQLIARLFAAYPATGAALLDALCALAGVAFGFVVMPAGDLLMGRDLQASACLRLCMRVLRVLALADDLLMGCK